MQTLEKRLEIIEVKIKKLLQNYKDLNIENKRLKEELSQYLKESSINNNVAGSPQKSKITDYSSQIEQYISELEECIELVKTLN